MTWMSGRQLRQNLVFELCPAGAGDDGYLDDFIERSQQLRHFGIEGHPALRERAIESENDETLHRTGQVRRTRGAPGGEATLKLRITREKVEKRRTNIAYRAGRQVCPIALWGGSE